MRNRSDHIVSILDIPKVESIVRSLSFSLLFVWHRKSARNIHSVVFDVIPCCISIRRIDFFIHDIDNSCNPSLRATCEFFYRAKFLVSR